MANRAALGLITNLFFIVFITQKQKNSRMSETFFKKSLNACNHFHRFANIGRAFCDGDVGVFEGFYFRIPNHGRLWKSLMRAYLGDYEKLEEKLRNAL
jgi:hypothetical protein